MPFELIVNLPNKPGMLAAAVKAIGRENVSIRAFAAIGPGKTDEVRFLVDNTDAAEKALQGAGYKVRRQEVLAFPASDTPGELAAHAENLSKAGINIEGGYLAASENGKRYDIILEVADTKAAKRALER